MGSWPSRNSIAMVSGAPLSRSGLSDVQPPAQQVPQVVEVEPRLTGKPYPPFKEFDVVDNPAVNPSKAVLEAYGTWFATRFPQVKNYETISKSIFLALRPGFPLDGESMGRLAASKQQMSASISGNDARQDRIYKLQSAINLLQMDKKDRKKLGNDEKKRDKEMKKLERDQEKLLQHLQEQQADQPEQEQQQQQQQQEQEQHHQHQEQPSQQQAESGDHAKSEKAEESSKNYKNKKARKENKDKKDKKGKKDKKKDKKKNKKDKNSGEKGPKNERIKLVESYLEGTSDSIARFAVPSQFILASLAEPDLSHFHTSMARASTNQYQAEQCYRYYTSSLRQCNLKDKKCLRATDDIHAHCASFARSAYELIRSTEL